MPRRGYRPAGGYRPPKRVIKPRYGGGRSNVQHDWDEAPPAWKLPVKATAKTATKTTIPKYGSGGGAGSTASAPPGGLYDERREAISEYQANAAIPYWQRQNFSQMWANPTLSPAQAIYGGIMNYANRNLGQTYRGVGGPPGQTPGQLSPAGYNPMGPPVPMGTPAAFVGREYGVDQGPLLGYKPNTPYQYGQYGNWYTYQPIPQYNRTTANPWDPTGAQARAQQGIVDLGNGYMLVPRGEPSTAEMNIKYGGGQLSTATRVGLEYGVNQGRPQVNRRGYHNQAMMKNYQKQLKRWQNEYQHAMDKGERDNPGAEAGEELPPDNGGGDGGNGGGGGYGPYPDYPNPGPGPEPYYRKTSYQQGYNAEPTQRNAAAQADIIRRQQQYRQDYANQNAAQRWVQLLTNWRI